MYCENRQAFVYVGTLNREMEKKLQPHKKQARSSLENGEAAALESCN